MCFQIEKWFESSPNYHMCDLFSAHSPMNRLGKGRYNLFDSKEIFYQSNFGPSLPTEQSFMDAQYQYNSRSN